MSKNFYQIYSASEEAFNGWIGFAVVSNNGSHIQGLLNLYDTVNLSNGDVSIYPAGYNQDTAILGKSDAEVIKGLMRKTISNYGANGYSYTAVDQNGTTINV